MVRTSVPVNTRGMDFRMSIGERLKDERERLGLTLPEFADIAGAKKNTVIDWQNDVSSPPASRLASLAVAGVDPMYVLTGVRSVARAGMSQADIDAFNQLIDDFFELDTSGRDSVLRMVSALAAAAATGGKARTVRKPSARREPEPTATAPLVAVQGKNSGVIQSTTGTISNAGPLIQRKGRAK